MTTPLFTRPRKGRGFTLIELLVVIAIIGVLIGLLLPAIQKVREAANRSKCQNSLHQLCVAPANYNDVYGSFPAAVQVAGNVTNGASDLASDYRSPAYGPNWAVLLLPYIEQDNLYKSIQVETYMNSNGTNTSWRAVGKTEIPMMICKSDTMQLPFPDFGLS